MTTKDQQNAPSHAGVSPMGRSGAVAPGLGIGLSPAPPELEVGEHLTPPLSGVGGLEAGGLYDVVIPAGGTINTLYAERIGTPFRALAPLGAAQTPVMQRVVDALCGSGAVNRIIAVAPPEVTEVIRGVNLWLPSGDSGPANILRGLQHVSPDAPALVCTSDLPLLIGESVRDFVARCDPAADISVGILSADSYRKAYTNAPPSEFVALNGIGPVTMACLFCLRPTLLARNQTLLNQVFSARKSQFRMARLLGARLLWQWARRSLSLAAIIARAERVLNARVDVLRDVPPDLCFDIDTADEYAYANAYGHAEATAAA